jgi:SAM-dependent methyltransferase
MVELASQRLQVFASRARVSQTQGEIRLPFVEQTFDRFMSTYVLDLLPNAEIGELLREAHRVLQSSGILALASLSYGISAVSKGVSGLWRTIHHLNPNWVGGCRPVDLIDFIDERSWKVIHHEKVSQFGITSEILVANKAVSLAL